jgi:hypothetical protein
LLNILNTWDGSECGIGERMGVARACIGVYGRGKRCIEAKNMKFPHQNGDRSFPEHKSPVARGFPSFVATIA